MNTWTDEDLTRFVHTQDEPAASLATELLATRAALAKAERILRREPTIDDFKFEQSGVTLGIEWWASTMLARSFIAGLGNAPNYKVQIYSYTPPNGPAERVEVTIQRVGRRSPHTARLEAEAEVARLRALCAKHGIEAGGTTDFTPDAPAPLTLEGPCRPPSAPPGIAPWVRVLSTAPTVYACTRCGKTAMLESDVSPGSMCRRAPSLAAFDADHAACEDTQTTIGTPSHR